MRGTKCGVDDTEIRKQGISRLTQQSYKMEAQIWVGTDEVVRGTRLLRSGQGKRKGARKEKDVRRQRTKRDLVTLEMLSVKTPSRTQAENRRRCKTQQREERAKDILIARRVDFTSH